jgi:hypothetical protein
MRNWKRWWLVEAQVRRPFRLRIMGCHALRLVGNFLFLPGLNSRR